MIGSSCLTANARKARRSWQSSGQRSRCSEPKKKLFLALILERNIIYSWSANIFLARSSYSATLNARATLATDIVSRQASHWQAGLLLPIDGAIGRTEGLLSVFELFADSQSRIWSPNFGSANPMPHNPQPDSPHDSQCESRTAISSAIIVLYQPVKLEAPMRIDVF